MTAPLLVPAAVRGSARPARRIVSWGFGPTALRLFALGLALMIPAWIDRRAVLVMFVWDAVVLAACAIELARMPKAGDLTVQRSWQETLALGVPASVTIEVESGGSLPVTLWAADYVPAALSAELTELKIELAPGATALATYTLVPRQRGDAALDLVAVRYRGPWQLIERWAIASLPQTVRVYPDLREAQQHTLAVIRARQIAMEKRRAHAFGLGRDFESLREFEPGDELRDVCWTATARRGRLVTKIYQPERSQTVWILIDTGRLMRARAGGRTRLDRAANAAFALAEVATTAGDRVALLAYGRRGQRHVPASRGAAHLRALLELLATVQPESADADHAGAAALLMTMQKRRALVVWLTDVAETAAVPEVIESATRMLPRHVVLLAAMQDRELSALARAVPAQSTDMYRVVAAQEVLERRATLLLQLRQRGAFALELGPEELTAAVIDGYLNVKERNLV
ncbi:MAG: hypothetical protein DMF86_17230 [Acidobacteria bacterium]|nr:MAG: hypothetical protein DMF86_17230 [Acidobacteriota bacterium]